MDTTTPDVFYSVSIEPFDQFVYINKTAFTASWATFIALAILLNIIVIACIVSLYVKRPAVRCGSPRFVLILATCLAHIVLAAGLSAFTLHLHRVRGTEAEMALSCDGYLALELSFFMLSTLTKLLVAAVVLTEVLQMQKIVTLTSVVQMAVAVVLMALSVLYVFVVIIPVFYMTWLKDNTKPCLDDTDYLNTQSVFEKRRIINGFDYILPHVLIFFACVLLLLVYLTRRAGRRPHGMVLYTVPPAPTSAPGGLGSNTENGLPNDKCSVQSPDNALRQESPALGTDNPAAAVSSYSSSSSAQLPPLDRATSSSPQRDRPFPWYVLLAAVVPFVFNFVYFFNSFVDTSSELDLTSAERFRLWAAGLLLSALEGVFLPCCWLLDSDIRASWCCCGNGARAPEGAALVFLNEGREGGRENGSTVRM